MKVGILGGTFDPIHNAHITIAKAMEQNYELRQLYESNSETQKLLDIAMALEGMPRQASTHACRSSYYKRAS